MTRMTKVDNDFFTSSSSRQKNNFKEFLGSRKNVPSRLEVALVIIYIIIQRNYKKNKTHTKSTILSLSNIQILMLITTFFLSTCT